MSIIGLVGPIGCGKDTVADILLGKGYEPVAFANPLKDVVSVIFGWRRDLLEGDTDESRIFREQEDPWWSKKFGYPVTPRKMLQLMGTEAGRDVFHPDIWIHSLEKQISGVTDVVITDVRFPNEVEFVRSRGGKIVRISREDPDHIQDLDRIMGQWDMNNVTDDYLMEWMLKYHPHIHFSEYAWYNQPIDFIIQNRGTLDDLKRNVDFVLTSIENPITIERFHHPV
jgi:hypothetical protein